MAPVSIRPLQYTLLLLLTLFILTAVNVLAGRSIWIDEAMLLRNVYEIGILDFLHPLPYYDQASPFIPGVIIKLISMIAGTNFILFRWLVLVVIALCAAPLLIKIARTYGINALLAFIVLCVANVYNILFIATEIKHYGFEVASVFIFLYWLLDYMYNPDKCFSIRRLWIFLLAIWMGFSTLLLVPAFFLFLIVDSKLRLEGGSVLKKATKKPGLVYVAIFITAVLVYIQMKYLTMFQIENTWSSESYGGKGIYGDLRLLFLKTTLLYSFNFLAMFIVISFYSWFVNVNSVLFRVNMFFTILVWFVIILKLSEFYPIFATRHLIWIVPITATIGMLFFHHTSSSQNLWVKYLRLLLIMFALLGVVKSIWSLSAGDLSAGVIHEDQDNNALYGVLENLEPSDVLVFGHARPSLEVYRKKILSLAKHRYFGLMPGGDASAIRLPPDAAFAAGPLREQAFTDWQFAQLPQTNSVILVISPADPIDHESAGKQIRALRNTLSKNRCAYKPIFTGHRVQLVEASCLQPSGDEEPARADRKRS